METSTWHAQPVEAVRRALSTGEAGLGAEEAARRLDVHGPNELEVSGGVSTWHTLAAQFQNTPILILLAAAQGRV